MPRVEKYLPTETGDPPLGNAIEWAWHEVDEKAVSVDLIDYKEVFPLELNTMPGWAGSSWYFNRYLDPNNQNEFAHKDKLDYWGMVDLYIGGSEHATGHLLYFVFGKSTFDLGFVPVNEYAQKLVNQGMILGESAFIYRKTGTKPICQQEPDSRPNVEPIHVDVTYVDANNVVSHEELPISDEFREATFELEDGLLIAREKSKNV